MLERLGTITRTRETCRRETSASHDGNPRNTFDGGKTMNELGKLQKLLEGIDVPEMRRDLSRPGNVRWLLRNVCVRNAKSDSLTETIRLLINLDRSNRRG
jgi:hypothetical protein